ncbi:MAG: FimV/HubP family polar landmark protein [Vibrio casei]|uniref:FimV/HubP family polar landmark protein n=1 Tax=Vibrio casei TaxID=673372 RepID=UPI003F9CD5AC
MRRTFKHFITPVTLLMLTQMSVACADDSDVSHGQSLASNSSISTKQNTDIHLENPRVNQTDGIAEIYGPTAESETLWSIAKEYRPNKSVSIPQVVLATYKINDKAFEAHNIHGLISGSMLRLPTLARIKLNSTAEANQVLEQDANRVIPSQTDLSIEPPPPAKLEDYEPKAVVLKPSIDPIEITVSGAQTLSVDSKEETDNVPVERLSPEMISSEVQDNNTPVQAQEISEEVEVGQDQVELSKVEEMNTRLTVELEKIQHQLDELKNSMASEEISRNQVQQVEPKSFNIDSPKAFLSIANQQPWLWVVLLLPILLLLLIIKMLFFRQVSKYDPESVPAVALGKMIEKEPVLMVASSEEHPHSSEAEAEAEADHYSDADLPTYSEDEAILDAQNDPEPFNVDSLSKLNKGDHYKFDSDLLSFEAEHQVEALTDTEATQFHNIDDLLEQSSAGSVDGIEKSPDLDVGLDEFPDVLSDVKVLDVDIDAEMNGNLDLAKVFIEMDDKLSANKLLRDVLEKGDSQLQMEAQRLLLSMQR